MLNAVKHLLVKGETLRYAQGDKKDSSLPPKSVMLNAVKHLLVKGETLHIVHHRPGVLRESDKTQIITCKLAAKIPYNIPI